MYIHELTDWPNFYWRAEEIGTQLAAVRHHQGRLLGRMEALGFPVRSEAVLEALTDEITASSRIEGALLSRPQVRSSVARRLGVDIGGVMRVGRDVEGVVEMTLDATQRYAEPLTEERLKSWHASLFPAGRSGITQIRVGTWRDDHSGPMQVVSGPIGRERVHFQAPPADGLDSEMAAFVRWFETDTDGDPVARAGLAHLWFVTVHPFEDGNGRLARAIADMALARSEGTSQRFYSMSSQIVRERSSYYAALERAQKGTLDVTGWMEWFFGCLDRAFDGAERDLSSVLRKAAFWDANAGASLNERQSLMLNRLLDGFEGKLTTSRWASLAKCSPDTALRDIQDLLEHGLLTRNPGGGRSTSYSLAAPNRIRHS